MWLVAVTVAWVILSVALGPLVGRTLERAAAAYPRWPR